MTELGYERALRGWAAARGIGWERVRYPRPEAGGDAVAYRLTPRGEPRGLVLPVHGAGNDALYSFAGIFKRLLLSGYEIFSFDVDGHGRHSTTEFRAESAGGAVVAAVERSGAAERGLPVHAFGVSLGGSLLLNALPSLGRTVRSAALLSAPLRIHLSWSSVLAELGLPTLRTLWRERRHGGLWAMVPSFGPLKRNTYPLRIGGQRPPGTFGYVEVLNEALERLRLEDAARRVSVPVLLVYGGADRVVPIEQGERLADLIPRSELMRLRLETHLSAPLAPATADRMVEWIETVPQPA